MGTKAEVIENNPVVTDKEMARKATFEYIKEHIFGSVKIKRMTEKQKREIRKKVALEMTPEKSKKMAEEYGFKNVL